MSNLVETLDLIGHLDFHPGCDWSDGCATEADVAIVIRELCACGNTRAKPLCLPHAKASLDAFDRLREKATRCRACGTLRPLWRLVTIDRIEPLR